MLLLSFKGFSGDCVQKSERNRKFQSEIGFGKLETYERLERLGEGTYATVIKGRSLLTNKFVALKVDFCSV